MPHKINSVLPPFALTAGYPASTASLLPRDHYRWRLRFRPVISGLTLPIVRAAWGVVAISPLALKAGEPALKLRRRELANDPSGASPEAAAKKLSASRIAHTATTGRYPNPKSSSQAIGWNTASARTRWPR